MTWQKNAMVLHTIRKINKWFWRYFFTIIFFLCPKDPTTQPPKKKKTKINKNFFWFVWYNPICKSWHFVNPIINFRHELTLKSVAKFMFTTHSIWPHNLFRSNVVPILLHTNHCNILNFDNNVCDCVALDTLFMNLAQIIEKNIQIQVDTKDRT
jgi:hypothetical protein